MAMGWNRKPLGARIELKENREAGMQDVGTLVTFYAGENRLIICSTLGRNLTGGQIKEETVSKSRYILREVTYHLYGIRIWARARCLHSAVISAQKTGCPKVAPAQARDYA